MYEQVLLASILKSLQEPRTKVVSKFVRKTACNQKFIKWFIKHASNNITTRADSRSFFKQVIAQHAFYKKSCIPTLTELANTIIKN